MSDCREEGCAEQAFARGWCRRHYNRWHNTIRPSRAKGPRPPMSQADRAAKFWASVDASGDCWLWTGARTLDGYGQASIGGERFMAHRKSYELLVGPIPDGLHIDHLCRNPQCVNPDHLEPVTRSVNAQRGVAGDLARRRALINTACHRGHEYTASNTYVSKQGIRMCRTCLRENMRASRARRKAAA